MGETEQVLFDTQAAVGRPTFNRSIRLETRRERLTGDAGTVLLREVMERVGLIEWLTEHLLDPRHPALIVHPLPELLRTALLLLAQGWTNADDADHLRHDPAFRLAVSERQQDTPLRTPPEGALVPDGLASQPTLSRLLATLGQATNPQVLQEANLFLAQQHRRWLGPAQRRTDMTLDIDSLPIRVHGQQDGSAYNGYYHLRCYHPLIFGSADTHELFGAHLRPGNVHTSKALDQVLPSYLDWAQTYVADHLTVRGDAGFPSEALLTDLEQRPDCAYVFRIKTCPELDEVAQAFTGRYQQDFLQDPEALREQEFRCHELWFKCQTWHRARRVVLVLLPPEDGQLFPRSFYLITNFEADPMNGAMLVDLYRQRGTYEQMIGQLKSTLTPQLSSTVRPKKHYRGQVPQQRHESRDAFATNQAILSLNLLAYNLLNLIAHLDQQAGRRPGRPKVYGRPPARLSPRTVRHRYLKVPARITLHGRRVWMAISERAAPFWQRLWQRLDALGYAPVG